MDWKTFRAKFADGAKIGLNVALKKHSLIHIQDGAQYVMKQATKAAKKYEPKKGIFKLISYFFK